MHVDYWFHSHRVARHPSHESAEGDSSVSSFWPDAYLERARGMSCDLELAKNEEFEIPRRHLYLITSDLRWRMDRDFGDSDIFTKQA
jgi:hypothetical protein